MVVFTPKERELFGLPSDYDIDKLLGDCFHVVEEVVTAVYASSYTGGGDPINCPCVYCDNFEGQPPDYSSYCLPTVTPTVTPSPTPTDQQQPPQ